mmetsp:Transcript_36324/g.100102  ORF Transcript_36324/g.100102 Transcript_36324/m.100102 type:complete len:282 (-) Transcript_36324:144-989(-)
MELNVATPATRLCSAPAAWSWRALARHGAAVGDAANSTSTQAPGTRKAAVALSVAAAAWRLPKGNGRHRRRRPRCAEGVAASSDASTNKGAADSPDKSSADSPDKSAADSPTTSLGRFWAWCRKNAKVDSKSLRKMGLLCLLSYGAVSNFNAIILIAIAAYVAIIRTGASPFVSTAALKQFGISWVGLYAISSLIRPVRVGVALSLSPLFERGVDVIQKRLSCRRSVAIALMVFLTNVCGTFLILGISFQLVSALTGVPLDVTKLGTLVKAAKAARTAGGA